MENEKKQTVAELLQIDATQISIKPWSGKKLKHKKEAEKTVRGFLDFRPRSLAGFPYWAEGAMLTQDGLLVSLRQKSGKTLRMEVDGYKACVQDASGRYWYFRAVPVDGWPSP